MIEIRDLPTVNAILNGTGAILLLIGYTMIRQKRIAVHKACMLGAFASSVLFFTSYLIYHVNVGSVGFTGQGTIRTVYFTILITHSILAVLVPPLSIITLIRGLRKRFERHKAIARWTLPIWLFVSVTGVVIYWMLYQL